MSLGRLWSAIGSHGAAGAGLQAIRKILMGRRGPSFRGTFSNYEEALANVRPGFLSGYDNSAVVDISFGHMSRIQSADERVLVFLERLLPETRRVLDLGGHMGTKYRAFRERLNLEAIDWLVYETPAMVRAGRERAMADGLTKLAFIEYSELDQAPPAEIALASGLLQYLDVPFADLLHRFPTKPRHLILNKVATWDHASVVTLENFGVAEVPYQVRNRAEFVQTIETALGYLIVDEWILPELSHEIAGSKRKSVSRGYYAQLRE